MPLLLWALSSGPALWWNPTCGSQKLKSLPKTKLLRDTERVVVDPSCAPESDDALLSLSSA